MAGYCRECGEKLWKSNGFICDSCKAIPEKWHHSRFFKNEKVKTEFGVGIVVGIDLPLSRAWRWLVKITKPVKRHSLIEQGKTLAFFDKEIRRF